MQAIVYHGQGDKRWEDGPSPTIVDDTAAIGRVGPVPICGTDLILGHRQGSRPVDRLT
jgi:alcohol dehydrogenase